MGRPPKFDEDRILDAAGLLVAEGGPAALTVSGIAKRLGAPSGSVYHRFPSRDHLGAALWLRAVEHFQAGWQAAVEGPATGGVDDPVERARRAAEHVLVWSRTHPDQARLLLLYRSADFFTGDWPAGLVERNERQRKQVASAMTTLCRGLGATRAADRERVRFAVIDLPYGAVRGPLSEGSPPPRSLDRIVDDAVVAVLEGIGR